MSLTVLNRRKEVAKWNYASENKCYMVQYFSGIILGDYPIQDPYLD